MRAVLKERRLYIAGQNGLADGSSQASRLDR